MSHWPRGGGYYNRHDRNTYPNNSWQQYPSDLPIQGYGLPPHNAPPSERLYYNDGLISNDIWTVAANSNLTPTAGIFVPMAVQAPVFNMLPTSQDLAPPLFASGSGPDLSGRNRNGNLDHYEGDGSGGGRNSSPVQYNGGGGNGGGGSTEHYNGGARWRRERGGRGDRFRETWSNNNNNNSQRGGSDVRKSLDETKEEGRRKLLAEAASLVSGSQQTRQDPQPAGPQPSLDRVESKVRGDGRDRWKNNSDQYTGHSRHQDYSRGGPGYDNARGREYQGVSRTNFGSSSLSGRTLLAKRDERCGSPKKDYLNHSIDNAASQRERLTEQLNRGELECLVCCESVRQNDAIWNCPNCHHVLHLHCTIKWAKSSRAENGWHCPACRNVSNITPRWYTCFCGQLKEPTWNRSDTAHSCGELCRRARPPPCRHACTLLCHPGPCPTCIVQVQKQCGCGKTSQTVKCSSGQVLLCGQTCEKPLNCKQHHCQSQCHAGLCQPCDVVVKQVCYCSQSMRAVNCDSTVAESDRYECGNVCNGPLDCNNHRCGELCHSGPCPPCLLVPHRLTTCHCGKTELKQARTTCLDPVPSCSQPCQRLLTCGQPNAPHECQAVCHAGICPPCPLSTLVRCRCGHMDRELLCAQLDSKADDARCQKKCTKKRCCGKHKCNQPCCIDIDHVCPLLCNRFLSCGQHRCQELCHRGHCQPCQEFSFDELHCECGKEVIFPPVRCGTRPPACKEPCPRPHPCDHPPLHVCHNQPECPPCTVLTAKYCYGQHELRKSVPCHQEGFSCGLACGLEVSCGQHKCISPCHQGDCLQPGVTCVQPCTKSRPICGHNCAMPCHQGPCPEMPCKEKVKVTCECGYRSTQRPCCENSNEYQRIATAQLASKMADVQLGRSVDVGNIQSTRKMSLKVLECNAECRVAERNRRIAIGLQIVNPDISAKLAPRYSDTMKTWFKRDPHFCQQVHEKLSDLVKLAKESKQKSRSHSFETMNREKRQFVHEYCQHFGCESVAYDAEPKRNVVATAFKDKSWLPSHSLLEVQQREMGQRKVPVPSIKKPTTRNVAMLPVRIAQNQPLSSVVSGGTSLQANQNIAANSFSPTAPPPEIDYFDYNPH